MERQKFCNNNTWVAIIAGGRGTRLFPLSHGKRPKQFCDLDSQNTFIQATAKRFIDFGVKPTRIVVIVTSDNQFALANEQLNPLGIISPNILHISDKFGYAGSMVKAGEFISDIDKDAVVINTPADQYIEVGDAFNQTMSEAVANAKRNNPTLVGVKVNDLVTAMGCGHALYDDAEAKNNCKPVTGFTEKPKAEEAKRLMREDRSLCNTGINVWSIHSLEKALKDFKMPKNGLNTDQLMKMFQDSQKLYVAIGRFVWHDCGTLKSLYDISDKTPNHKNASLGKGYVDRTDCHRSLFITIKGVDLYATGVDDAAVVVNEIEDHIVVVIARLEDSQKVRDLAEDYKKNKAFLTDDFSMGARNNRVSRTGISGDIRVGFVCVDHYTVTAIKYANGNIAVIVSNDAPSLDAA